MANSTIEVAEQLNLWFQHIQQVTDEGIFGIAPPGPHRDAVVLDTLMNNARLISESELDKRGKLYSPLCFFLVSASRTLNASLGPGHWRAALDNVVKLERQLDKTAAESAEVGLEIGGPAALFKQQFDESIKQAGLAGGSYLDKASREIALGLAVNWGMRLLLAYALNSGSPKGSSTRRDLAWIAQLEKPLVSAS